MRILLLADPASLGTRRSVCAVVVLTVNNSWRTNSLAVTRRMTHFAALVALHRFPAIRAQVTRFVTRVTNLASASLRRVSKVVALGTIVFRLLFALITTMAPTFAVFANLCTAIFCKVTHKVALEALDFA
jgi:hypothetical protein